MLYSRLPSFVFGFHGCHISTAKKVVSGKAHLRPSTHDFDWLGAGIYFWENDPVRAIEWAREKAIRERERGRVFEPAIVGAAIDLGECLNLLDVTSNRLLRLGYKFLKNAQNNLGLPMPVNRNLKGESDLKLRHLDCAVINSLHALIEKQEGTPFDSVRAAFIEGDPVYPKGKFYKKTHVQICVRNTNSIKGYFHVRPNR
jgi:hypothetical protein